MAPTKKPELDDPNLLVRTETASDHDAVREMAFAFTDEFARLGYDPDRILELFRNPFYVGPHGAWRALGDSEIRTIVAAGTAAWNRVRIVTRDREPAPGSPPPCALPADLPEPPTAAPRQKED